MIHHSFKEEHMAEWASLLTVSMPKGLNQDKYKSVLKSSRLLKDLLHLDSLRPELLKRTLHVTRTKNLQQTFYLKQESMTKIHRCKMRCKSRCNKHRIKTKPKLKNSHNQKHKT